MNNTKLGLSENAEAALSYLFGFVSGLIFLIIEKENQFVKFHALQSILFSIGISILNFILSIIFSIPFFAIFGIIVCGFVGLASFVTYVFLIVMAYLGRVIKIPVIGEISWNLSIK